jgi:hypothetical protein
MESSNTKLEWKIDQLWNGCILAGIAHAIMVAHYPLISNEHSWDGSNYNTRDNAGTRGTVSFSNRCCTAAFRNDNCNRFSLENLSKAISYFHNAPKKIVELAETETLQYLLYNAGGQVLPVITTAFWGKNNELFTVDSTSDFMQYGGKLLKIQTLNLEKAVNAWKNYYGMSKPQIDLLKSIYERKIEDPLIPIFLTREEIEIIGTREPNGLEESLTSFQEMGIYWETVILD